MTSLRRKKPRVSRKGRKNLTFKDKVELISTIERNLSNLHEHDWQTVSQLFNQQAVHDQRPPRSATSVRSAFNKLRNRKKPTGDAHLDDLIDRANKLHAALYRNGKSGNSPLPSDDDDDSPPPEGERSIADGHPTGYGHAEDGHGTNSQSSRMARDSPALKRPRTSNILHGHDRASQHGPPALLSSGSGPQFGSNLMTQSSKEFMVPMPETQQQSTPQRNLGTNSSNNSSMLSSSAHRNNMGMSFPSFAVTHNNTSATGGNEGVRNSKPRTSDIPLMVHSGTAMTVQPTSGPDLLNQSANSIHHPVFIADGVTDNSFELINTLKKENDLLREECLNLRSKEIEFKTDVYNLKKDHDNEISSKETIIAEKDARIERLLNAANNSGSGSSNTEDPKIRILQETLEEKNRNLQLMKHEIDLLKKTLSFNNQKLENMKELHEMELKKLRFANDLHQNGNND